jgi:Flp pilus assembly protein TadG
MRIVAGWIMERSGRHWHGLGNVPRRSRRGAVAAEFALCLPFLLTLAWGFIETCNLCYVRTRMYSVAYEGARVATRPTTAEALSTTSSAVTTLCNSLLTQLGVSGGTVSLAVADSQTGTAKSLSVANPQDLVTVSIAAPLGQNSIISFVLSKSTTMNASATLVVE